MVAGPDTSLLTQPSRAIKRALDAANLPLTDVDLFELNEAFAAVGIAPMRDLGISDDVVNVNGGAIALGHPVGMSGRADRRLTLSTSCASRWWPRRRRTLRWWRSGRRRDRPHAVVIRPFAEEDLKRAFEATVGSPDQRSRQAGTRMTIIPPDPNLPWDEQPPAPPVPPQAQVPTPTHAPPPFAPPGYAPPGPTSPGYAPHQPTTSTNGFAVAALVLGIVGPTLCVAWILALVFGYVGRSQIRASGGRQTGKGMATAGVVLGWVWGALIVLYFVIVIISSATTNS